MGNKPVDNYPHALALVSEFFMTQEMCEKVVNTHSSKIQFVPECYKTGKICDKAFNKSFLAFFLFLIDIKLKKCVTEYVPDQYKIQEISDKAVRGCLAALKFVPDWFVTSKRIKRIYFVRR